MTLPRTYVWSTLPREIRSIGEQLGIRTGNLIRAYKKSEPLPPKAILLKFIRFLIGVEKFVEPLSLVLKSLEGMVQSASVEYYFMGIPTSHGAPIPIKMFRVRGSGYTSFAATFPLFYNMENNKIYAPYRFVDTFARLEITSSGLVIDPNDTIRFKDLVSSAMMLRGDIYDTLWYDFMILHGKAPRSVGKYVFQPARGPLKNLLTRVYALRRNYWLMYIYTPPRVPIQYSKIHMSVEDLLEEYPTGWGYKHGSVLYEVSKYCDLVDEAYRDPAGILFARVKGEKDKYVLLRPFPVNIWDKDEVDDLSVYVPMQNTPPYYYRNCFKNKRIQPHYVPGTIVYRVPELEYVVAERV